MTKCIPTLVRLGLVATLAAGTAMAEPIKFGDFSAKRIGPPKAGVSKRITVQVDPEEQARLLKPPEPKPKEPEDTDSDTGPDIVTPVGRYAWFWEMVGHGRVVAPQDRFELAMRSIAGSEIAAARLTQFQALAQAQGVEILKSTIDTRVSPALVLAVMMVESAGRPDAVSHAGAQGLMQLMPATAERFGVSDSFEPGQNIKGGVAYLDWLMNRFDGDPVLVLAGYNAGEGAVDKYEGVPPYAETRDYVPKVLAAYQVARGLCLTPPELVSDGCVFASLNY